MKRKTIININDDILIGKDQLINVGIDCQIDIGGTYNQVVDKDAAIYWMGAGNTITAVKLAISSASNLDLNAAINLGISCGVNMDITSIGIMTLDNISMITKTTGVNWITNLISVHNSTTLHKITGLPIMLN